MESLPTIFVRILEEVARFILASSCQFLFSTGCFLFKCHDELFELSFIFLQSTWNIEYIYIDYTVKTDPVFLPCRYTSSCQFCRGYSLFYLVLSHKIAISWAFVHGRALKEWGEYFKHLLPSLICLEVGHKSPVLVFELCEHPNRYG